MKVTVKTKKNDFSKMEIAINGLDGKKINVGALKEGSEHAFLVGIHEYGCKIKVTPKMRAWFAAQGFPLKKSTTEITIPERSFLRTGFDENHEDVLDRCDKLLPDVMIGTMSEEKFLETIGFLLAERIKDYATDLKSPPNSGMTTQMKGSSNPLVDTGDMIESIIHKVE